MILAEAHDERRATSATASRGRCYHWHWSADNFGHDQTSRYKAKRGVRSAAATELKLGVPLYEMYLCTYLFYQPLLYVLLTQIRPPL